MTINAELFSRIAWFNDRGIESRDLFRLVADLLTLGKECARRGIAPQALAALAFDLVLAGAGAQRVVDGREYGNAGPVSEDEVAAEVLAK